MTPRRLASLAVALFAVAAVFAGPDRPAAAATCKITASTTVVRGQVLWNDGRWCNPTTTTTAAPGTTSTTAPAEVTTTTTSSTTTTTVLSDPPESHEPVPVVASPRYTG